MVIARFSLPRKSSGTTTAACCWRRRRWDHARSSWTSAG